ncbi:hypothetical protein SM611_32270 [Actinomadura sp. DLS-62]|uniref:Uncharacterized protein n=1 Tax=Actinomadura monticuli TaxID=3097367 RepID=A0ABV4QM54_9ACTN
MWPQVTPAPNPASSTRSPGASRPSHRVGALVGRDRYVPPEPEAGPPDGGDPRSPAVWLFLARDAERRMRDRLAGRVAAALGAGDDAFAAWNGNLALAARTAEACPDRVVLEILATAPVTAPAVFLPGL